MALVRAGRIVGTGLAAALLLAGCYYYRGEGPPANYEFRPDAPNASDSAPASGSPSPFAKTETKAPGPPPPPRQETQTPKPSDYAVWVPGEWRYMRNEWVWWAGRWDAQPLAKEWKPGAWEPSRRGDSWEYRPGGWFGGPEDLLALAALQWLAPSRPPPPLRRVLGGTQSLHTNSLDEALGLPSEHAVEIALRTQQVIGYESGVADVIDPLGGSYYIEQTTDALEAEARNYIDQIDALGGAVSAIEQGYQQAEILEAASSFQREVETEAEAAREGDRTAGKSGRVIVGVNRFETNEESDVEIVRVDPTVRERQIEKLERLRDGRDQSAVSASLDAIQQAANSDENLVPLMLDAVKQSATLGEISDALRTVWGEYRERIVV